MKNKISKILLAICSVYSVFSTAFCTEENEKPLRVLSENDCQPLEKVTRKSDYDGEVHKSDTFISHNGNMYFPEANTYVIGNRSTFKPFTFEELYDKAGNDFSNVDTIVYEAGSFDSRLFNLVLGSNNVRGRGTTMFIVPLNPRKDFSFPMSIIRNGFKFILSESSTGHKIEFNFVLGKTIPLQGEKFSLENAIKAYNYYVEVFCESSIFNPYGIKLIEANKINVNDDVISDVVAANRECVTRGCCKNFPYLNSLLMPEAKIIYEEAFENCVHLRKVNMPMVSDIGRNAFCGCKNLENVSMPNVKIIDKGAFEGCESLKSLHIPEVEYISENAFKGCKSLKFVEIPESTITLDASAFEDCSSDLKISYGGIIYESFDQFVENSTL